MKSYEEVTREQIKELSESMLPEPVKFSTTGEVRSIRKIDQYNYLTSKLELEGRLDVIGSLDVRLNDINLAVLLERIYGEDLHTGFVGKTLGRVKITIEKEQVPDGTRTVN
jgi:hypothetical protein